MNENRKEQDLLDSLKNSYQQIPVPEEARLRLLKGIQQAKEEMGGSEQPSRAAGSPNRKKRIIFITKRAAATTAAALAVITVLANSGPTVAMAMGKIPVIGAIADVVTFRTYESKEGKFEANLEIPEISLPAENSDGSTESTIFANQDIEDYANKLIAQYEETLKANGGEGNYSLTSTWDVVFENDRYVSIRIRTTQVMASGAESVKIFNVDKSTGETVSLKTLLKDDSQLLEDVSNNIKDQMRAQMAADESISYFLDSENPEWDFKGLTGEESYYFDQSGQLVITFDEYEVAPGYMGAVEFTIPKDITGDLTE